MLLLKITFSTPSSRAASITLKVPIALVRIAADGSLSEGRDNMAPRW